MYPGAHAQTQPDKPAVIMAGGTGRTITCAELDECSNRIAQLRFCVSVTSLGGTVIMMEKFDAKKSLQLIERHNVTHSQWVLSPRLRV